MLRIYYGDMDSPVAYGPSWFKYSYNPEWFTDSFVQAMLQDVDKCRYLAGYVIDSPVFGPIPPEKLSGGLQTLIMIYKMPEKVFDATSCGENCAKWLLEIGKRLDVTVNLNYFMPMESDEPFEIEIVNAKKIVRNAAEYTLTSLEYL